MDLTELLKMLGQGGATPTQGVSAPNAMQTIQARKKYNDYYIQAAGSGEQPLPFEQWVESQRQPGMMR